jgi:GNAT superfamily N-acetyltransferase
MTPGTRRRRGRTLIREVREARDPAFSGAHRLLRGAFPRSEMLPQRDWRVAIREREQGLWTDINWHLLVAERDGELMGAASGSYLGNVNVGVIGYIATTPDARSHGLGPRLRRRLGALFEQDARRIAGEPLRAIVGEVRRDNPWLDHLIRKEGAIALDFPYRQPSLGGAKKPVPLVLYYQPASGAAAPTGAEVRRLLYTMWRRMYRIAKPLSRPEFRSMIRSLDPGRRVPRLAARRRNGSAR